MNDAQIASMQFFSISVVITGVISADIETSIASLLHRCKHGAKHDAETVQLHHYCTIPEA